MGVRGFLRRFPIASIKKRKTNSSSCISYAASVPDLPDLEADHTLERSTNSIPIEEDTDNESQLNLSHSDGYENNGDSQSKDGNDDPSVTTDPDKEVYVEKPGLKDLVRDLGQALTNPSRTTITSATVMRHLKNTTQQAAASASRTRARSVNAGFKYSVDFPDH
ncbi:hypothetical protein M427DRAFT_477136 [Gonapodya prolifera JEL478]|uniref:Uncharacterized protein n=1 Tax=Gonapodya prolifera (strain JEL478) TaxID=1344416 RepID=A0A139A168_GONPJ|nr:hypothetical protein M427DRAFT_477136 [Gonapodya prolifera JEL478]|eukprot:KXS10474.1 hypothetical protein M427DRAFT_477136 [Gonapodya prolifera JEL478]